ncbi:restriction endonuclease subunit S [Chryseobacterium sp.]|uniref:restriction endonuclease subunit S n=1 Tax=Chryseobacterium sp. TaxID=1871047 RepID=UPI00289C4FC1|nr:restriction endonuclease subunit S [Chryseobacterium sp.]
MQRYEKYKDSGVDWIGEIPEQWEIVRFKRLFKEKKKTTDSNLNSGSISFGEVVYKNDEKITEATKQSYQVLNEGEFLLNPLNMNYDLKSLRIGLSAINVVVSSGYIILQSKKGLNKNYYRWLLRVYDIVFMKTLGAGVRQTINYNDLADSHLVVPSFEEQQTIANFLDDKTAKIDQTIGIKEKEIELLKERRQILIQKAVTKGLDDTVKLKDSGVDWIGEIPEHWEVRKLRFEFDLSKGLTITKENLTEEGVFCLNYGEIHSKYGFEVNPQIHKLRCVSEEYLTTNPNALLNNGDFIFADTSEDLEGSGNFTYLNSTETVLAGYHTVIVRPKKSIVSRFFAYEFDSQNFRNQVRTKMRGVKVFSITQSILKDLTLWIPPYEEQQEITGYLDKRTSKIDQAILLKQQEIEKLKYYKTVLVDNVVTGKVRVTSA